MEMYALVRFDTDIGYISSIFFGEYEMEFSNGKIAKFRFEDSNTVRQVGYDNRVLNIHLWNLDIDENPDSEFIKHFAGSIAKIIKFPVMVVGIGYIHIKPTALIDLKLFNNDLKYIDIDKNLLVDVFKN